jgi:hypothetical protein
MFPPKKILFPTDFSARSPPWSGWLWNSPAASRPFMDTFALSELAEVRTERVILGTDDDLASGIAGLRMAFGFFDRLVLGSVTARMLPRVGSSALDRRPLRSGAVTGEDHCRKVLCALDLGYRSRRVLEWATFLAAEYQAELMVLHAVPETVAVAAGQWPSEGVAAGSTLADARNRIEGLQAARSQAAGLYGPLHQHRYSIVSESPCPVLSLWARERS